MSARATQTILRVVISVLALGDGVLHLLLNQVLFRGRGGPPPGAPRAGASGAGGPPPGGFRGTPFPLPLSDLFMLNFIGEVVLVAVFLLSRRLLGERRWLVDVAMIGYAAATFVAWIIAGAPNPMGLGYLSKGIEIILIIALLVDLWTIFRTRVSPSRASAQAS